MIREKLEFTKTCTLNYHYRQTSEILWVHSRPLQQIEYHNKESHTNFFSFPVHIKVIFILYCSLLSMLNSIMSKKAYIP